MVIARTDPMHPDALTLIAGSEAELSALYDPSVRYAFSPDQLMTGGVRFFVGREGAEPVACGGSYRDEASACTAASRKKQTPAWNASDPQFPKSEWWLADCGFVGFRLVCEPAEDR